MFMVTTFNPILVALSILVAILASFVALNFAHTVTQAIGRAKIIWLAAGALAMGIGIWSMHFIGMLAFAIHDTTMAYDVPLMLLSIVVAIGASALALHIVSRSEVYTGSILGGGAAMAAAIAGMHYIGMYSMRMAATIQWNKYLVALSILIALLASIGALLILTRLRDKVDRIWQMIAASVIMGVAISGMHYTGMLAATFVHSDTSVVTDSHVLVSSALEIVVIIMPVLILALALASSISQRIWTSRKLDASDILGKSEERFRLLIEAVKDYAIFMLDPQGYITTWNSGAQRINGYKDDEIIGKHVSIFSTQQDRDLQSTTHELKLARETGHFEGEGERVRKDGSRYWANVVIAPLYDRQGKLTGFSKVTRDVTTVKETDRRLRQLNEELEQRVILRTLALTERENQLRTITNAVPVLIAQVDLKERFLFANDAFCKWFRKDTREVVGSSFKELLGPDIYPHNEPHIKKVLMGNLTTYERESKSGDVTAMLGITFVPEFDNRKKVIGFIIVASDITKHKQIEAELKQAKEAAEVANTTKSAFLANMSHEIRTPLGAVLGFSELLLSTEMSPSERLNSVEVIKRNGRLLSNVINDILDLSKVEAGKLEIEIVEIPFTEILKEMSSVLSLEASERGIELNIIAEGAIPNKIWTDPLRLRQILLNIIGNAIKFTSKGSVTVKVKLQPSSDGTTKLAFVITDTGEGIRPEHATRLFTPFTQADASTTRKFGGTGLGLVLSKRLAVALGGDVILLESTLGKGSTFIVTINPGIAEQVLFQSSPGFDHKKVEFYQAEKRPDLSRLNVLVADDSPDNQLLIKKILKRAGASVETANNGREAVDKAMQGNFSVVLMDLQMPEMDGYEATRLLRSNGFGKPIIALTAHAMKEERQRSLQSGFDDHITKPIDHELLVSSLSAYLN